MVRKYPEDYVDKIICGDCLEVMKGIPDNSVDLVLTDPPYGITPIRNFGVGSPFKKKDMLWDKKISKESFDEIFRISQNQVIFGGNYYTDLLKPSRCWLVWNKMNGNNPFADFEMIWTSFKTSSRMFNCQWVGGSIKETIFHPTQKPTVLIEMILQKFSNENNIVLDPFLGSGTTAVACRQLNRRFIGIEINPDYCKIARERLMGTPESLFKEE